MGMRAITEVSFQSCTTLCPGDFWMRDYGMHSSQSIVSSSVVSCRVSHPPEILRCVVVLYTLLCLRFRSP